MSRQSSIQPYPLAMPAGRRRVCDLPLEEQPSFRLKVAGPRHLSGAELLALILDTVDALDLAQDVLAHFGSLYEVGRLTTTELMVVPGVQATLARRIRAAAELGRRMAAGPQEERPRITSPADAARLLVPALQDLDQEHMILLLLNGRAEVIDMPTLYVGSQMTATLRAAEIFRAAILQKAISIILAHNHPSGDPSPSPEDLRITEMLVKAGRLLDIEFKDHVVVGHGGQYVSIREKYHRDGGWS